MDQGLVFGLVAERRQAALQLVGVNDAGAFVVEEVEGLLDLEDLLEGDPWFFVVLGVEDGLAFGGGCGFAHEDITQIIKYKTRSLAYAYYLLFPTDKTRSLGTVFRAAFFLRMEFL